MPPHSHFAEVVCDALNILGGVSLDANQDELVKARDPHIVPGCFGALCVHNWIGGVGKPHGYDSVV